MLHWLIKLNMWWCGLRTGHDYMFAGNSEFECYHCGRKAKWDGVL